MLTIIVRETCPECGGTGKARVRPRADISVTCSACAGIGYIDRDVPELLGAARECLEWWHSIPTHFRAAEPPWVAEARAAIAKATNNA